MSIEAPLPCSLMRPCRRCSEGLTACRKSRWLSGLDCITSVRIALMKHIHEVLDDIPQAQTAPSLAQQVEALATVMLVQGKGKKSRLVTDNAWFSQLDVVEIVLV